MKVGYFATGVLQRLDFAEFAAWGAAQGFGGIDVAPARPDQVRIARQSSTAILTSVSTS